MLKSGDLGPTGLVVGQSGWEAQNRENPTKSGDITCMLNDHGFMTTLLVFYLKIKQYMYTVQRNSKTYSNESVCFSNSV